MASPPLGSVSPDNPISLQAETVSLESGPQLFNLHPPTHAGRNPDGLHQVSRKGKVIQLSNAQKATKQVQHEAKQAQESYFNEQFEILLEKQFLELGAFAEKHDKKVDHLQKLLNTSLHYKKKRAINLENAKLHAKALEVNADRAQGDCAKLPELCQLVKEDLALHNLSDEAEKLLKDGVLALQDLKKTGARPSNKACSLDYHAKVSELNNKVSSYITFLP